ncbi:hypothetical protein [Ciceribacter sp. RN22]|uniref:hypothetical protein n=1 Tax=Ciceribacter sp. RN22 TaxID=2954932 RepID=UPI002093ABD5|nr:hypothetical protein [Ciceribacter sp. RN22]MCO6177496.1 hypothetical protein [Ciceribacter sp. RN22]
MKLSAPTVLAFLVSLVLAAVGVLSPFGMLPAVITAYGFWSLAAGYGLLALAVLFRGL